MAFYQFDASAIVKRYAHESGSEWVRLTTAAGAGNVIGIADPTRAEITSALSRRTREGVITLQERDELVEALRAHSATQYRVVPAGKSIVDLAMDLTLRRPLRAYDAVQLATAITVNKSLIGQGLPALIFVCADDRLIAGAQAEGLNVLHPAREPAGHDAHPAQTSHTDAPA